MHRVVCEPVQPPMLTRTVPQKNWRRPSRRYWMAALIRFGTLIRASHRIRNLFTAFARNALELKVLQITRNNRLRYLQAMPFRLDLCPSENIAVYPIGTIDRARQRVYQVDCAS